jgi:hypothetical protein
VPFGASMYVLGPIIAFVVIAALAAILRWTFRSELSRTQAEIFAGPEDFGLLCVAGVVEGDAEARIMQSLLSQAGIRSTVAPSPDGRVRVLVFEKEIEAARRLVGGWAV